ncbi:hypothetical protein MYX75_04710 [Acidobacteria bacterium AH-259-A15]|nr:hypothetical protein [Acidobacteria bacterium AH-259-A15]
MPKPTKKKPSKKQQRKRKDPLGTLLKKIKPKDTQEARLQLWTPQTRQLSFYCGDGKNGVLFTSSRRWVGFGGKGKNARPIPSWVSKLSGELTEQFKERNDTTVSGVDLLRQVQSILRKYLHFADERVYLLLAVWLVGTYLYSIFNYYGYFHLHSKEPRCGKTRTMEVCSHLAFEADKPLNCPTAPTIRDTATSGRTLQLDTLERWRERSIDAFSTMMEYLDAGFRKGGKATKMVPVPGTNEWRREDYEAYAPYVLAGINKNSLSDTARDRSFSIEMVRKSIRIQKREYDEHNCEMQCKPIRNSLYLWAWQNAKAVSLTYGGTKLRGLIRKLQLNDRGRDIWKPLFAVLTALGFSDQSKEWKDLSSIAIEMHGDSEVEDARRHIAILGELKGLKADAKGRIIRTPTEFVDHLRDNGFPEMNHLGLRQLMQEWEFRHKSRRVPGKVIPLKTWKFSVNRLNELEAELQKIVTAENVVDVVALLG